MKTYERKIRLSQIHNFPVHVVCHSEDWKKVFCYFLGNTENFREPPSPPLFEMKKIIMKNHDFPFVSFRTCKNHVW